MVKSDLAVSAIKRWHMPVCLILSGYRAESVKCVRKVKEKFVKSAQTFPGRRCGRVAESRTAHDGVLLPGDDEREETHDRAQLPGIRRADRFLETLSTFFVLHEQSLCQYVCSVHSGGN